MRVNFNFSPQSLVEIAKNSQHVALNQISNFNQNDFLALSKGMAQSKQKGNFLTLSRASKNVNFSVFKDSMKQGILLGIKVVYWPDNRFGKNKVVRTDGVSMVKLGNGRSVVFGLGNVINKIKLMKKK